MGTPIYKPTTQKMNCTVTISHMSKEEIAAKYGVKKPEKTVKIPSPKNQALARLKASLPSRRKASLKDTIDILKRLSAERKPIGGNIITVVDMTVALYFQGLSYEEAFRTAKEWREGKMAK